MPTISSAIETAISGRVRGFMLLPPDLAGWQARCAADSNFARRNQPAGNAGSATAQWVLGTVCTVPFGYLTSTALVAWCTLFAVAPPRPPHSSPRNVSYWFGFLLNELPFVAFYWLLASTLIALAQGDIDTPVGWVSLGIAVAATAGLVVVVLRAARARPVLDGALNEGLGAGWRTA